MRLNKLLQTQIKRFLPANSLSDTQMVEFINAVSNTYNLYQKELPTGDPTCSDDGIRETRLPDGAVKESQKRIVAALKNCNLVYPRHEFTVNMAPADIRKGRNRSRRP